MVMTAEEQLLTAEQISDRLQVHIETVRRWIRSGELPGLMFGRRGGYRVKEVDLQEFLKRYRRG